MRIQTMTLLLALALAPGALAAQGAQAAPDPAAMLVGWRTQLGLSREQVARINRIGAAFREQNAADLAAAQKEMQRIREKYGKPPYPPEVRTRMFQEATQVSARYGTLAHNGRLAQQEMLAVLTPEQQQRLQ